jgi:hypothetical protein
VPFFNSSLINADNIMLRRFPLVLPKSDQLMVRYLSLIVLEIRSNPLIPIDVMPREGVEFFGIAPFGMVM